MVIKKNEFYKLRSSALALLALLVLIFLASLFGKSSIDQSGEATDIKIPDYSGAPFVIINNKRESEKYVYICVCIMHTYITHVNTM